MRCHVAAYWESTAASCRYGRDVEDDLAEATASAKASSSLAHVSPSRPAMAGSHGGGGGSEKEEGGACSAATTLASDRIARGQGKGALFGLWLREDDFIEPGRVLRAESSLG